MLKKNNIFVAKQFYDHIYITGKIHFQNINRRKIFLKRIPIYPFGVSVKQILLKQNKGKDNLILIERLWNLQMNVSHMARIDNFIDRICMWCGFQIHVRYPISKIYKIGNFLFGLHSVGICTVMTSNLGLTQENESLMNAVRTWCVRMRFSVLVFFSLHMCNRKRIL